MNLLYKKSWNLIYIIAILVLFPTISNAEVKREILGVEFVEDFVLEPAKNEVILEPGQTSTEVISITNRINKNVSFKIEVEDIVGSDDPRNQVKLLGNEKGPYSLRDFIIPEVTEFSLQPGEKITIPVAVNLPSESEPRGYYGAIIVSSNESGSELDESTETAGTTKIVTRLGSIFLVRIKGEANESVSLHDFKILGPAKKFYASKPTGFEVAVKNEGNVHLVHYGEVKIKNIFGKEIERVPVNAYFSLPDSIRYREINTSEGFAFGYYKAELNLYKGFGEDGNNLIIASVPFVVLPWKIVVAIFIGAVILIMIARFLKNNFKIERKK